MSALGIMLAVICGADRPLASPACISCGELPYAILASGGQAFCGNPDCDILFWDATLTRDDNMTDAREIDLSPLMPKEDQS